MQLSICIPTYNRVEFLELMVKSVLSQIEEDGLCNEVELVISNNCSNDGTEAYLHSLPETYPAIKFQLNTNGQNIGFVRNIVRAVEISTGKYWWFIGDDDAVPDGAIKKLVDELKMHPKSPLFIFNQSQQFIVKYGAAISVQQCAENFHYYMGNAITVCSTALSKAALEKYHADITSTCWPQTHIYYLCMFLSGTPLPVRVSSVSIFKFNVQNNIRSASYHLYAHFQSLFKMGYLIAEKVSCPAFVDWFPKGIPFINGWKKYSWAFHLNLEYRFFDFEDERREFDDICRELDASLLRQHRHYLRPLRMNACLPSACIKYYHVFVQSSHLFAYDLLKKRKWTNPLRRYRQELAAFNNHKAEKLMRKQTKHIRSTSKSEW